MVHPTGRIINGANTAVSQFPYSIFKRLLHRKSARVNFHFRLIKHSLIGFSDRSEHDFAVRLHSKTQRTGNVAVLIEHLLANQFNFSCRHDFKWHCNTCLVGQLTVILTVQFYNAVKRILHFLCAGLGMICDTPFDGIHIQTVCFQRAYVVDRYLVQFAGQLEAGANLTQQVIFHCEDCFHKRFRRVFKVFRSNRILHQPIPP